MIGDHFELEAPSCNTDNFQLFLDEFSKENSTEFKVILLDNAPFHKAKDLTIPANMALLFIPPYAPELNPAEKIWWRLKREFTGKVHLSLEQVSDFIAKQVDKLSKEIFMSICQFE